MSRKYCAQNGCHTLIQSGQYCEAHQRRKRPEKRFYSKNSKFYRSEAWQALAAYIRQRDGYRCCICGKVVFGRQSHVDHILPIWLRPDLRLDEENLRHVCSNCHPIVEYQPKSENEWNQKKNFDPDEFF